MNKIEKYIDGIYRNFDTSDKNTKILEEEMKAHLYEEVAELKKKGLTEEESITKVLDSFGEEDAVVDEMNSVLKNRSVFRKMLIKAAVIVLIIGCISLIISIFHNNQPLNIFSIELSKNGFRTISYLLIMVSLAIFDISYYYYYYIKRFILALISFLFLDCILIPILFASDCFPNHEVQGVLFVLGITLILTLILRVHFLKIKKWS